MNASSQWLIPVNRLMWKEYRAHRALWLLVLLLGWATQILFKILNDRASEWGSDIWSIAAIFPLFYSIASLAIVFSGEREDRTCDWLRQMAVPAIPLLISKWGFVALSTLLLALTLSLCALLLAGAPPIIDEEGFRRWLMYFVCGVFAWGSFGALISRRVVTAVLMMGLWWVCTMFLPLTVYEFVMKSLTVSGNVTPRAQGSWYRLSMLLVSMFDIWLAWRWSRGKYLDAQAVQSQLDRCIAWARGRLGFDAPVARVFKSVESPYEPQRVWQRLAYQERHRESLHVMIWWVGCGLALTLLFDRERSMLVGIVPLVVFSPLFMGLLSFRSEGEGQPRRFLSNRGISPSTIWLVKNSIWLPRAFWVPGLVLATAAFAALPMELAKQASQDQLRLTVYSQLTFVPDAILFALLGYASGQLAAMVMRKMALACGVGLFLNIMTYIWLMLMIQSQVPRFWSVGGVVLWLIAVTFWYGTYWLEERPFRKHLGRLIAFVTIPPILLVGAVAAWRVIEVGGIGPETEALFDDWHLLKENFPFRYVSANGRVPFSEIVDRKEARVDLQREIDRQSQPMSEEDIQALEILRTAIRDLKRTALLDGNAVRRFEATMAVNQIYDNRNRLPDSKSGFPGNIAEPSRNDAVDAEKVVRDRHAIEKFWMDHGPRLRLLLDFAKSERLPSVNDLSQVDLFWAYTLLVDAGLLRTDEGSLKEALDYYCAALRLATVRATSSGLSANHDANSYIRSVMMYIFDWANHPNQSSQLLRTAFQRIEAEFEKFPSLRETLVAEYRENQRILNSVVRNGWLAEPVQYVNRREEVSVARFLPWERIRSSRILERELVRRDLTASRLTALLKSPGVEGIDALRVFEERYPEEPDSIESRCHFTSVLLPRERDGLSDIKTLVMKREEFRRGSLLGLSLLAWKASYKQWPPSLPELLDKSQAPVAIKPTTLIDPWSGELFSYNPNALHPTRDHSGRQILLSSVGPDRNHEVYAFIQNNPDNGSSVVTKNWRGGGVDPKNDLRFQLMIIDGKLRPKFQPSPI